MLQLTCFSLRIHKQFLVSLVNSKRRCTNRKRKKKHTHTPKPHEMRGKPKLLYSSAIDIMLRHITKLSNRIFLNYIFHKTVLIYLASATQYSSVCVLHFVCCVYRLPSRNRPSVLRFAKA